IHYYKSKDTQKCWIPKYEKLYKLVPKYFQDDENNTFVLTYRDFHSSNILVKNNKITGIIDWEYSNSNFISIIDNIDKGKKEFYSVVFSQEVWKVDFLDKFKTK
ncbi:8486_t:CDS:2, partial [Gigaspora margarita]